MTFSALFVSLKVARSSSMRRKIGISRMKARIMEGQLKYLHHILRREGNILIERVVDRKMIDIRGGMVTKDEIRNKLRMLDTKVWKKEMEDKTSLKWYKE